MAGTTTGEPAAEALPTPASHSGSSHAGTELQSYEMAGTEKPCSAEAASPARGPRAILAIIARSRDIGARAGAVIDRSHEVADTNPVGAVHRSYTVADAGGNASAGTCHAASGTTEAYSRTANGAPGLLAAS